jgi:hypothetical protein
MGGTIVLTRASSIKSERIRWLWKDRIPLGMPSLITGLLGEGKSTILYDLAARVSRGQLPGDLEGEPRDVLISSLEDSWAHVVRPRLEAAGADLDRVLRLALADDDAAQLEYPLSFPDNLTEMYDAITRRQAAMLILDPSATHISGKVDSHKDADLSRVLTQVSAISDETDCSIVGNHHLNKASGQVTMHRLSGGVAFAAVARAIFCVGPHPDLPGVRALAPVKLNVAPWPSALKYKIEQRELEDGITTSGIVWMGWEDGISAGDLITEQKGPAASEAADWLRERLEEGAQKASDLYRDAAERGISERTLERAKKALKVRSQQMGRAWFWVLPT